MTMSYANQLGARQKRRQYEEARYLARCGRWRALTLFAGDNGAFQTGAAWVRAGEAAAHDGPAGVDIAPT